MNRFPDWNQEFTSYLLDLGYTRKNSVEKEIQVLFFSNLQHGVMVYPSGAIVFYHWTEGTNDNIEEWRKEYEFSNYGLLTLIEFKMLLHIVGIAQVKEFVEKDLSVIKTKPLTSNKRQLLVLFQNSNLVNKRMQRKKHPF